MFWYQSPRSVLLPCLVTVALFHGCRHDGSSNPQTPAAKEASTNAIAEGAVSSTFMSEPPLVDERKQIRVFKEKRAAEKLTPFMEFIAGQYGQKPTYHLRKTRHEQMHYISQTDGRRPDFLLLYSPLRSYCAEKLGYRSIHPSSNYYRSVLFTRAAPGEPRSLVELAELAKTRKIKLGVFSHSTSSFLAPIVALAEAGIPHHQVELQYIDKDKGRPGKKQLIRYVANGRLDVAAMQNTLYDQLEFNEDSNISAVRPMHISRLLPSGAFMVHDSFLEKTPLSETKDQLAKNMELSALKRGRHTRLSRAFADLLNDAETQNEFRDINVFKASQHRDFSEVLDPLFKIAQQWFPQELDPCKNQRKQPNRQ